MASTAQFKFFGPFFQAGVLAGSIKLYHYAAGTTTLKDAWTDRAKSTTAAQPVVGDANGIVSAYFDGLYKLVVKDSSDVTLYTWDNVDLEEVIEALPIVGGNLTGGLNTAKSTVASATNPDIFAVTIGNTIDYTGTATCTGFAASPQAGAQRTLICSGAAVFTASANMLIDGVASGSNFTAAAGAKILVVALTTTVFHLALLSVPMYQEGTWTPSVGGTATYTLQIGSYVKIGNVVYVRCVMTVNVLGTGSTTTISGLPFIAYEDTGVIVGQTVGLAVSPVSVHGLVLAVTSTISMRGRTAAANADSVQAVFGNGASVIISGMYRILS
jgi:hypothetical protein